MHKVRLACTVLTLTSLVFVTGCSAQSQSTSATASSTSTSTSATGAATVTIEDNHGNQTLKTNPKVVVSTDNRTFETLQEWGIKLAAAPRSLMPSTIAYKNDASVVDIGNHREPNLEALAATNPDFILNGQRFTKYYDEIKKLNPDASILELEPREGKPLISELKRQTTALGQVFGKTSEAQQLNTKLDQAVSKAKTAYKSGQKVLAVDVSGDKIGFVAPSKGRFWGPLYDELSLTPALTVANASDSHTGDDVSVEAIAQSNPDWILVIDRDAAIKEGATPAKQIIENNEALKNLDAVKKGHIVYAPADTYTNESVQTYTEVLNSMADAFSKA